MTVRVAEGPKKPELGFLERKLIGGSEPPPDLCRSIPTAFCKADTPASGFKGK